MRPIAIVVLAVCLLALTAGAGPAEDRTELAGLQARLQELTRKSLEARFERPDAPELRFYGVADLTVRLDDFIRPNMVLRPVGSDFDEESPQFGAAREGPTFFGPDELRDLLARNVRPAAWTDEGRLGIHHQVLWASATPDVHAELRAALDALRADLGRIVTIEVWVIRGAPASFPAAPLDPTDAAALLGRVARGEAGEILAGVEVTGYAGQRIAVFDGRQRAYVQDYDVEVAQNARIADPIVGVQQEGLAVDVRALPQGRGRILLDLRADFVIPSRGTETVETPEGKMQVVHLRESRARTTVSLPDGGCLLVGGTRPDGSTGARVTFLVRARANRLPNTSGGEEGDRGADLRGAIARTRRLVAAYEAAAKDDGPLFRMRLYPVEDLLLAARDEPGPPMMLTASGAGFSDDDWGEEPIPFFELDQLVELVRSQVAPGSWEELSSAEISATEKNLVVVHTAGVQARVAEFLGELRARAASQVALDVEVVSLADADRQALLADGPVLSGEAMIRLRGWLTEGRARSLDSGRVVARDGQRVALVDTEPRTFVYDYDVEIASGASIGDPLVQKLLTGLVVDVRPTVAGRGDHVVLVCRLARALLPPGPLPEFETPVGKITLPVLRSTTIRCTVAVPAGRTVVVGGGFGQAVETGEAARPLMLLTPRVLRSR